MALIKPLAGQPARIKVVGVGGGGGNALTRMIISDDISGVEFIALNTDSQALLSHKADVKIQIGENLTRGLGSGGDPEKGALAAEESREKIREALEGADMVFIAAGEGGGTGTGAAPVVASVSQECGALTVAVVTRPFDFEGRRRHVVADEGIKKLRDHVDTLIIIPNQKVLQTVDQKVGIMDAFGRVDSVLHQGVKAIAELIVTPGLINVDFADVRSIMAQAGTALMGIGVGTGEKRINAAIKQAINSPLLETSIEGARGVLFNIVGGSDMSLSEVDEAASIIQKTVDPDAEIIFGAVVDERLADQVKITVIATKFDEHRSRLLRTYNGRVGNMTSSEDANTNAPMPSSSSSFSPSTRSSFSFDDSDSTDDGYDVPTFLRK